MDDKKKIVMLYSGGCDSAVMLQTALSFGHEVKCLGINYGQRHNQELRYAADYINDLYLDGHKVDFKEIDCSFLRDIAPTSSLTNEDIDTPNVTEMRGEAQPLSYVPFRNQLFISIAASYAEAVGASEIWYGATGVDSLAGYFDGTPEFVEAIQQPINLNREKNIKVVAPLIEMNKKEIITAGVHLGVDFGKTYTCYTGGETPSAYSASSSMRIQGFIDAGYKDPITYLEQEKIEEVYKEKKCVEIY